MKDLFLKYKPWFLTIIIVFSVLLIFTVIRLVLALNSVKATLDEQHMGISADSLAELSWNDAKIRNMKKDVYWMEQQLVLAKSDSINLGFNLTDSIVQVQLKGTVLFKAKILKQHPVDFLNSLKQQAYFNFGSIASITTETSTIPKKPIKKVIAPKSENEKTEVKQDSVIVKPIVWQFSASNHFIVIITGVELDKDSVLDLRYKSDMIKYRTEQIKHDWLPKNYIPTLYIWLPDKDAKAIYRALPENGKIIFRN